MKKSINARLDEMTKKISDPKIFDSDGLGNEINFHIFDYDPEDEYVIRDYLYNYLLKKEKLNIKLFDIYDLIVEILEEKGFLKKVFDFENKKGTKYVNALISKTIGVSSVNDLIVKKIKDNVDTDEKQIIILTGIGKCYGIVRGHTILNNLQATITKNPVIMMYPGTYINQGLQLFNKLENDNYYRAFQLVSRK